jgi:hypothetical protein
LAFRPETALTAADVAARSANNTPSSWQPGTTISALVIDVWVG